MIGVEDGGLYLPSRRGGKKYLRAPFNKARGEKPLTGYQGVRTTGGLEQEVNRGKEET